MNLEKDKPKEIQHKTYIIIKLLETKTTKKKIWKQLERNDIIYKGATGKTADSYLKPEG